MTATAYSSAWTGRGPEAFTMTHEKALKIAQQAAEDYRDLGREVTEEQIAAGADAAYRQPSEAAFIAAMAKAFDKP